MNIIFVFLACFLWGANGYPYPYYGNNFDTFSYGSSDINRGGMVLSRYYNPYLNPRGVGGGMAAFMYNPTDQYQPPASQYYLPDRRRQTQENTYVPQQNEVYYPQIPDKPVFSEQPAVLPDLPVATEPADAVDPTEKFDLLTTTTKAIVVPELVEPEVEEVPKTVGPKRRLTTKKQVKRPVEDEEEESQDSPRMPSGAYFPMFFSYGKSGNTPPGGATAIANAFSTGRGGVATSHATAYGPPKPEYKH